MKALGNTCSLRKAALLGLVTGMASSVGQYYWIVPMFKAAGQSVWLAIGALGLLGGYLALYPAVWCAMVAAVKRRTVSSSLRKYRLG
ncbi:MAG: hypothetical protein HYZ73_01555 [Elusimicrobia bacterium]|nr:hypothetical protein [Elusimicrobiota bacterium]